MTINLCIIFFSISFSYKIYEKLVEKICLFSFVLNLISTNVILWTKRCKLPRSIILFIGGFYFKNKHWTSFYSLANKSLIDKSANFLKDSAADWWVYHSLATVKVLVISWWICHHVEYTRVSGKFGTVTSQTEMYWSANRE